MKNINNDWSEFLIFFQTDTFHMHGPNQVIMWQCPNVQAYDVQNPIDLVIELLFDWQISQEA